MRSSAGAGKGAKRRWTGRIRCGALRIATAPQFGGLEVRALARYTRITVRADQMGGVPCIRGLRIPVATVVKLLAAGYSEEDILGEYPDLEHEDIRAALAFAAEAVDERQLPVVDPA
jgi:uncharacterized protein (DUF433 family)